MQDLTLYTLGRLMSHEDEKIRDGAGVIFRRLKHLQFHAEQRAKAETEVPVGYTLCYHKGGYFEGKCLECGKPEPLPVNGVIDEE